MDYTEYYNARSKIIEIMEKDLLGPLSENEIICDERPLDYYLVGKLYPQQSDADDLSKMSSDDCGNLEEEDIISLCNGYNPSSFGVSFSLNKGIDSFIITGNVSQYIKIEREIAQNSLKFDDKTYKKSAHFWQRKPIPIPEILININDLRKGDIKRIPICNMLNFSILFHKEYPDGTKTFTVSMINENKTNNKVREAYVQDCINSFFQPYIKIIAASNNTFGDVRRNVHLNDDPEIRELNMLYSKVHNYASGHGCAVNWVLNNDGNVQQINTSFLPTHEIKLMMSTEKYINNPILQMKYLSEARSETIIERFGELISDYFAWIAKQRKLAFDSGMDLKVANKNLDICEETANLLKKSIELFNDKDVFKAFSLANLAMFEQRKRSLINTGKYESDGKITWYPFQLAFFIKELYSIAKVDSVERNKVDLLWFPTGGGKTEAYLGLAAFTIFLRKIKYGDNSNGTTVLMRYTLRLLSFQQFERASALICACEIIRKSEKLPVEMGIGLWAGQALTPNTITNAAKILNGDMEANDENGNPVQLEKCPWCGAPLSKDNYSCNDSTKRMLIKCSNSECEFRNGLPVYLIDEEIYKYKPSFIIGTVDKFAQLALNDQTSNIFGIGQNIRPPELIIQDELHLISGPLGTITGVYEAAIKKMCEYEGHYPKIIASTATIRNANEQIKQLYDSNYTQFPPQGIDINDSFFAVISNNEQKPARLYLGCMAIGTSPTTMMIRVMSSLLFSTRYLAYQGYDEKIIDSFWTISTYFNTLRELGGAIIRVVDDIQDRFNYLKRTKFATLYPLVNGPSRFDNYKELTSREKSENIGNVIQNELKIQFKKDGTTHPYDFLLCSNMISVGVDVGRLGTMVVVGQPKATSEYIQATSRVGRETPGLVIATYNQAKSRDRSHLENFTQYHQSFYKFVEATSVTPFSVRARDRALQALYVILCRYLVPNLKLDTEAINYKRNIPELNKIKNYIFDYVKEVDPDEYENVIQDIEDIESEWERKTENRSGGLKYRRNKRSKPDETLFDPDFNENSRFRVLNTMRSVETMINVIVKE
jgi:hypothetical protein